MTIHDNIHDMNKNEFQWKLLNLLFIYLCLSIECLPKLWIFLHLMRLKCLWEFIWIRNILIWVECFLNWYYNLVSLSECSLILPPIQLMCPISFYGQVTLIVSFLFLVWVFDFYALSSFILFSIIPSIIHTNFPPLH